MESQTGFIFKILLVSTILSILIKYGGRYLPIQPTVTVAAIAVLSPALIIGFILGWQYFKQAETRN